MELELKKLVLILGVAALTLSTMACDMTFYLPHTIKENGRVAEENRSIESFNPLNFREIGNLNVSYREDESLTIEAEDNLFPYCVT